MELGRKQAPLHGAAGGGSSGFERPSDTDIGLMSDFRLVTDVTAPNRVGLLSAIGGRGTVASQVCIASPRFRFDRIAPGELCPDARSADHSRRGCGLTALSTAARSRSTPNARTA